MDRNWAGNVAFAPERFLEPSSVAQLQDEVARSSRLRAVGTGHSFNAIAATGGVQVSLARLPEVVELDPSSRTVTVSPATTYARLSAQLQREGWALANLGSLPHISVAGACATGTHGSGDRLGVLGSSVVGLDLVRADGELVRVGARDVRRPTPVAGEQLPIDAFVVALGALGIVTSLTLSVEPTYDVRQCVYERVPLDRAIDHLDELLGSQYSVSLLTTWREDVVDQVWQKHRVVPGERWSPQAELLGGRAATVAHHPVPSMDPATCTEQLGVPGPWNERLPHFRIEHTPSSGDELQSEYLVRRADATDALRAVAGVARSLAPVVQISEIRSVASDRLWLSPANGHDCVAIHFTWVPDAEAVATAVDLVERRLSPFAARPHWGKVFHVALPELAERYGRLADFARLADRLDPDHKLRNDFLDALLPG